MRLRDSRRLTGPNILWHRPSAVIDVVLETPESTEALVRAWETHARRILDAVGWGGEDLKHRCNARGVSLALSAPIDALYAATEVNEYAFEVAAAELVGETPDGGESRHRPPDFDDAVARLKRAIAEERNPKVLAMRKAAGERGVAFLWDDDRISVGMGKGSLSWPADAVPDPPDVDWGSLSDLPVALVTGTNGKTTTVRLLAQMVRSAGFTPGISSTDGCWVAGEEIGEGDYSGPGGARLVLRDPRVEIAILETARGGMLRRGLGIERADVAIITNVAEDHLGEWGIHDLDELVETKFIVEKGTSHLVLNADDAKLRARVDREGQASDISWFSCQAEPEVDANVETGGETAILDGDQLVLVSRGGDRLPPSGETREIVATLDQVPMTLGGAARHNIQNALGAICIARRLGLSIEAIRRGLESFDSSAEENPGRLNRFDLGGAVAIVDFAHNPHGVAALMEMAAALPAKRRLVVIGQAGDRDDEAIRELPRMAWRARPDRVIVKELRKYLRGRALGEIPAMMEDELRRLGATDDAIEHADSELEAVEQALRWAREGDLLLLIAHEERQAVLARMAWLKEIGWQPGDELPEPSDG